jgi:hypothetical protein
VGYSFHGGHYKGVNDCMPPNNATPKHATCTHSALLHFVSDYSSLLNVMRVCSSISVLSMHSVRRDSVNNARISMCVCVYIYIYIYIKRQFMFDFR